MAVRNFDVALRKSTEHMAKVGLDRTEVWQFWVDHTQEGTDALAAGGYGTDVASIEQDDQFFVGKVIVDIQRFVFGDVGEAQFGYAEEPATEKEMDGWLGRSTHERMITFDAFERDDDQDRRHHEVAGITPNDFIVWKGERIQIEGVKVISLDEEGALSLPVSLKKKGKRVYAWPKGVDHCLKNSDKYATHLGTDHWDAGHSAPGAFRSLVRNGLFTTMGIDNPTKSTGEVVVYQWGDPGLHRGMHARNPANRRSLLSTDYSDAVYKKFAAKYLKRCGIARPLILADYHHRRGSKILGMYKGQVLAGMRMKKAFAELSGLPFVYPTDKNGHPFTKKLKGLWAKGASCVHQHLNITANKFDCAGLMAQTIVLLLTVPGLMAEFLSLVECFRLHDDGWAVWLDDKKATWEWAEVWPG